MKLSERVSFVIERSGKSRRAISIAIGQSSNYLQKLIERDATRPDVAAISALARELGVSETWLLTGRGSADDADSQAPAQQTHAPDDHVQPPAAEGSPLERALGEAFDPKRHTVTDLRAVQDALGSTYRWERPEADLLAAARTWLDSAAALRREGRAVDAVALLDRVTFGKTSRAREVAAEREAAVNDEADAELAALGLAPGVGEMKSGTRAKFEAPTTKGNVR